MFLRDSCMTLNELTTPEMFRLKQVLEARGHEPGLTEVTQLDAEMLARRGCDDQRGRVTASGLSFFEMGDDQCSSASLAIASFLISP
jgi:hypothetical protein